MPDFKNTSILSPDDIKNPLKVNLNSINKDKGKKGKSDKHNFFLLDE
jgi:hypothetical protein